MRAFRYHAFGSTAPRIEDAPVPEPGRGEVLVRVHCASVNPVDWKVASGTYRLLVKHGLPRTMGSDFCGVVSASGSDVGDWSSGERVMGFVDPFQRPLGTFADYVPVPAEFLHRVPDSISDVDAAALACVGTTAVALCNLARVGSGSNVLVNGASGGVGHLALQVAKLRGAQVTASASAARREFVCSLGADEFIDRGSRRIGQWPGGFDAVIDCVPNLPRGMHRRLVRRGGHYASTLPDAFTYTLDPLTNRLGRITRRAVMLQPHPAAIDELIHGMELGRLRCHVEDVVALEDVERAVERSRSGRVAGKLVIRIA